MLRKMFAMVLVVLAGIPTVVTQAGPRSGGGADSLIFPTGKVTPADPFAVLPAGVDDLDDLARPLEDDVVQELEGILSIYAQYMGDVKNEGEKSLRANIFGANRLYISTDSIPARPICNNRLTYSDLPSLTKLAQSACTDGNRTFRVKSLMDAMSARDRALTIFHEGFRRVGASDKVLITSVQGMMVALAHYDRQKRGDFSQPLDENERRALLNLVKASLFLRYGFDGSEANYRQFMSGVEITPFGGLASKTLISDGVLPTRFGIGARHLPNREKQVIEISKSATVLISNICERAKACVIGEDVRINGVDASASHIEIGAGSTIENSKLFSKLSIGRKAKISNVELIGPLTADDDVELSNLSFDASLQITVAANSILKNIAAKIRPTGWAMGIGGVRFDGRIEGEVKHAAAADQSKSDCSFMAVLPFVINLTITVNSYEELKTRCE